MQHVSRFKCQDLRAWSPQILEKEQNFANSKKFAKAKELSVLQNGESSYPKVTIKPLKEKPIIYNNPTKQNRVQHNCNVK